MTQVGTQRARFRPLAEYREQSLVTMKRGEKMRFTRLLRFSLVLALLILVPSGCARPVHYRVSGEYTAQWSAVQLPEGTFVTTSASATMSESEYKRHCAHVSYKDFQNDLNAHKGEDVYFKGEFMGLMPADEVPLPSLSFVTPGLLDSAWVDLGIDAGGDYPVDVLPLWPGPLGDGRFGYQRSMRNGGASQLVEIWGECQGACNFWPSAGSDPAPNVPVIRAVYMTVYTPD